MGKSTISMAIFNSYVKLPEGILNMMGKIDKPCFSHHQPDQDMVLAATRFIGW